MRLFVTMDYLTQDPKSGRFRYRRRVPSDLIKLIGKREFSISLKTDEQRLALERYARVHKEVEAELEGARAVDPADADYRSKVQTLRKYDLLGATAKSLPPVDFSAEPERFVKFTEAALRAPDRDFDQIVEAKFSGLKATPIRLSKAVDAYLAEHKDADNERDLQKQTALVVALLKGVMKEVDPLIEAVDIEVAYAFRDALRSNGAARGTIQRRINTIRAVLNFAKQRFQLTTFANPFSGLEVPKTAMDRRAKDSRFPLTGC